MDGASVAVRAAADPEGSAATFCLCGSGTGGFEAGWQLTDRRLPRIIVIVGWSPAVAAGGAGARGDALIDRSGVFEGTGDAGGDGSAFSAGGARGGGLAGEVIRCDQRRTLQAAARLATVTVPAAKMRSRCAALVDVGLPESSPSCGPATRSGEAGHQCGILCTRSSRRRRCEFGRRRWLGGRGFSRRQRRLRNDFLRSRSNCGRRFRVFRHRRWRSPQAVAQPQAATTAARPLAFRRVVARAVVRPCPNARPLVRVA